MLRPRDDLILQRLAQIFWLGELVEFGATDKLFTRPEKELTDAYLTGKMG